MTVTGAASIERSFTQADFDRFAQLSGDANPIHTDPAFAAQTRFGRTVAHGVLLASILRGLIERLLPGGRLLEQSVMFPAPSFAGETMRFTVAITGEREDESELQLQVLRVADGTVTCRGSARVRP